MKAQKVFSALTAVALNVAMAGQVYAETASTDAVV
jgi:hypothetical protein